MPTAKRPKVQEPHQYRLARIGLLTAVLLGIAGVALTSQLPRKGNEDPSLPTASSRAPEMGTTNKPTVTGSDEVVARLHEIFRVRDRAIQTRDPSLLEDIYTVDCPCLKGDQQLLRKLKEERLVWRGVKVTLSVQNADQINDELWTVNALVTTTAFDIVRESGAIVRRVPQGQERSRFALARPMGRDDWSLGYAAVTHEGD
jgi:hypothetical protein